MYNKSVEQGNNQKKILYDRNYYIKLKNKELQDQQNKLSKIQEKIMVKDRLLELNNEEYKKKSMYTHVLLMFFPFVLLMIFPYIAFLNNNISYPVFLSICMGFILLYGIYAYYKINSLKMQKFYKPYMQALNSIDAKIKDDIYKYGKKIENNIYKKCDCPKDHKKHKGHPRHNNIPPESLISMGSQKGLYYFDGSAPQQRIIPDPYADNKCPLGTFEYNKSGDIKICCQNNTECHNSNLCSLSDKETKYPKCGDFIQWTTAADMGERATGKFLSENPNLTWMPGNKEGDFGLPKEEIVKKPYGNCNHGKSISNEDLKYLNKSNTSTVNL